METRKIGSLDVPVVGLGCNNFGGRLDQETTARVLGAALDHGVTFFDTADLYGGTKSEEFMGHFVKTRREEIILATKFGHPAGPTGNAARAPQLQKALEDSLRRLQTDYVDLYQLHAPHDDVPIAETLGALDELVKAGKVREIGCSNFSVPQLEEADKTASGARFVSLQNEYSIFKRQDEAEILPACARLDVAYIPYFPLASGLLSGKYRKDQVHPEGTRIAIDSKVMTDENLDKVEKLVAFAEGHGRTLLELAFGYLLSNPTVASVIAGATKPEQVAANAAAAGRRLSSAELDEVRALVS